MIRQGLQGQSGQETNFENAALEAPLYLSGIDFAPKEIQLDEPSWESLGEQLLAEYKLLTTNPDQTFYNRKLIIRAPNTKEMEIVDVDMEVKLAEESEPIKDDVVSKTEVTPPADSRSADEAATQEPVVAMSASLPTTTDGSEIADKESSEFEQAALKRKRKEIEERSGLR
jgi:hypothetical protein